jgi:hypothetical protein
LFWRSSAHQNFTKTSDNPQAAESKKSSSPSELAEPGAKPEPYSPCMEIGDRLRRFVATDATTESWKFPASCYQHGGRPEKTWDVRALPQVGIAVATVPNPVSHTCRCFLTGLSRASSKPHRTTTIPTTVKPRNGSQELLKRVK